jgi:serine/threonine protein kinase
MSAPTINDFQGTARFLVQKRLGAGGFGAVYQAYDRERDTIVALKTLHKTDAEDLYRFKKEFRALADIVHPNLAALYELFSDQEQWFFTMEMINGKNFFEYVKLPGVIGKKNYSSSDVITASILRTTDGTTEIRLKPVEPAPEEPSITKPLASRRACSADLVKLRAALKQLVVGLSALHQAGKLHRDIKPPNVLVTAEGRVVILDFGLVGDLSEQGVNEESSDNIVGTPAYMSPEQSMGLPITPASDWYSVGVMLFEALTGELPFAGAAMAMMLKKQANDGLPPSERATGVPEDLNLLCQDLLQRDAKMRPHGIEILRLLSNSDEEAALPPTIVTGSLLKPSTTFVGREQELEKLAQAWQIAKQGQAVTFYIKGRSGMGKSALARHFLDKLAQIEPDLLVFSGRCYEQESVPYKAMDSIIDLLSRYLKSLSDLEVETILPIDAWALARLFPVLRQVDAIANSKRHITDFIDSQELRRKAFGALRELLARLANKKDLILCIDDLQWGDLDSAALLSEILRPPDAPRLLLIGSYRSEEIDKSIFLRSLSSYQSAYDEKGASYEINIDALSALEAQKLATALLGAERARVEVIVRESGGSPFFIGELAQYALAKRSAQEEIDSIEMKIDTIVSARIAQLPEDGRRLLEVVAVSGQPLARAIAKQAAELEADEHILPILRASHLLRSTSSGGYEEIDTYHDRIREAVIANLSPEALIDYHRNLAIAFEDDKSLDPERLAKHYQMAGESDKACDYAIAAADQAAEALAFDRAAHLYQQTLSLKSSADPVSITLKIKLADALANAGKGAEAAKAYLAATADSTKQEIFELQRKAAEHFLNVGYTDEGLELLNEVFKKAGLKLIKTQAQTLTSLLLGRARLWLRDINYQERNQSDVPAQQLMRIDAYWTVLSCVGAVSAIEGLDFQTQHLLLALDAGEPNRLTRALALEAGFSAFSGLRNRRRSAKFHEMALMLANKVNNPELQAMAYLVKSHITFMEGEWRKCWENFLIGEKITLEQCLGMNQGFALRGIDNALPSVLRSLYYAGNINQLLARVPQLLKDASYKGSLYIDSNLKIFALYIKHLVADEPGKARQELSQVSKISISKGFHRQQFIYIIANVEVNLYSEAASAAWDYINQQWPLLKKSFLLHCQLVLIEALNLQARAALAMAKAAAQPASYLAVAERNAKRILREKTPYGDGYAALILASAAASKGDLKSAIDHLTAAEKRFENADMALYTAVARRRRGELLAGDTGSALIEKADSFMREQQVKNPARITNMCAPGRWLK